MKLYAIPYNHRDGTHHTLDVYAHSPEDARHRIREAFYQGNEPEEIVAQIPVPSMIGRVFGK